MGVRGVLGASLATASVFGLCGAAPVGANPFFAVDAVTVDAERFVQEWERPGAHVDLRIDSHVPRGGSVTAFVIFKNCTANAAGACDVRAHFSLVRPDGSKEYPASVVLWRRPSLGADIFMRANGAPTFRFEPTDRPGPYRIVAEVTDRVAGVTLTLTTPITYG